MSIQKYACRFILTMGLLISAQDSYSESLDLERCKAELDPPVILDTQVFLNGTPTIEITFQPPKSELRRICMEAYEQADLANAISHCEQATNAGDTLSRVIWGASIYAMVKAGDASPDRFSEAYQHLEQAYRDGEKLSGLKQY
ncbi:hypothetical protein [Endozoicomonas sp.]|uniref:hypothetical protein n=1 Tax=Endozoicomonas sp. TaxID=1892382 RepID=UPI003D9AE939